MSNTFYVLKTIFTGLNTVPGSLGYRAYFGRQHKGKDIHTDGT